MIDVSKFYNAEVAAKDAEKAKEQRADSTFYSNMEKYKDTYDEVMARIKTAASNGLNGCTIENAEQDYVMDTYVRENKVVPEELATFDVAHRTVFFLVQALGYGVKQGKFPVFKDNENPLDPNAHPVGHIAYASITWGNK